MVYMIAPLECPGNFPHYMDPTLRMQGDGKNDLGSTHNFEGSGERGTLGLVQSLNDQAFLGLIIPIPQFMWPIYS